MNSKQLYDLIHSSIPDLKIYLDHPLAPYTTLKIGGPADVFVIVEKDTQLRSLVKLLHQTGIKIPNCKDEVDNVFFGAQSCEAREHQEKILATETNQEKVLTDKKNIPITIIGNGSNLVISDDGLHGLVIKLATSEITIDPAISHESKSTTSISTQRSEGDSKKYLDFSHLDYDETDLPQKKVTLSAGIPLPYAINFLINQGLTGLQWFAYIPGTIGGAVYGNIHGGSHNFSELVDSVEIFDFKNGQFKTLKSESFDWQYDQSIFQLHPEWIIISVTLKMFLGDIKNARLVVDTWIKQKQNVQSMNSAGSVFKNPSLEDCQRLWGEQKSTGWIIDQVLGLKGIVEGEAQVSPKHANFIINHGHATASDYSKLVKIIQQSAKEKLNLELIPEVKFLGKF